MSHKHLKQMCSIHKFDWSNGATIDQAKDMISYIVDKLQQATTNNPLLQAEVQGQLQALNRSQLERGPMRPCGEEVIPWEWKKSRYPLKWSMHITMIPLRRMEEVILPPLWIVM